MELGDKSKKIIIIHDFALASEGLRLLIETHTNFKVVCEARVCAETFKLITHAQPDIVLFDTDLKDEKNIAFLSNLIMTISGLRVLVLAGNPGEELQRRVIQSGAAGLFLKDQHFYVLMKAIEKVIDGELWINNSLTNSLIAEIRHRNLDDENEMNKIATLTIRELEIIALVCEGLRNQEIADRLFINEKTVRNHLSSIFSKLRVTHRLELSVYAQKHRLVSKNQ